MVFLFDFDWLGDKYRWPMKGQGLRDVRKVRKNYTMDLNPAVRYKKDILDPLRDLENFDAE